MHSEIDPSDIASLMEEMFDKNERNDIISAHPKSENYLQSKICDIWIEILGFSSFKLTEDLFDAGGDSIAAIQIFSEINKEFGIRLPMEALFSDNSFSVEWLAGLVEHHLVELIGREEFDSLITEVSCNSTAGER